MPIDNVGNFTAPSNAATVNSANQLGRATAYTYKYDDLYRLTGAASVWQYRPSRTERFTLAMSCDSIHNVGAKE